MQDILYKIVIYKIYNLERRIEWQEGLALLVKQKVKRNQMFSKLIELVKTGKSIVLIKKANVEYVEKTVKIKVD